MSMLKNAIRKYRWLSGVLPIDVRVVSETVKAGEYAPITDHTLSGCRSPFTCELHNLPQGVMEIPLLPDARICGWYELGNLILSAPDVELGVLLAERSDVRQQVAQFYMQVDGEVFPFGDAKLNFDENWAPAAAMQAESYYPPGAMKELGDQLQAMESYDRAAILGCFMTVCFANALANCKNVRFVEDYSGQDRRAGGRGHKTRHGKEPRGLVWRRLVIDSPAGRRAGASRVNSASPARQSEVLTRMHLARGHFKTYTSEAPLLGRHVGRWWWSPQVRGDRQAGVVLKDYAVGRQPEALTEKED